VTVPGGKGWSEHAESGAPTSAAREARSVLVGVEQLDRPVPGGIGRYVRGLLAGLGEVEEGMVAAGGRLPVSIRTFGARGSHPPSDFEHLESNLPVKWLGWAWAHGMGGGISAGSPHSAGDRAGASGSAHAAVGAGASVFHATSLAFPTASAWRRAQGASHGYGPRSRATIGRSSGIAIVVTVHDLAWRAVPEAFPARGRRWHEQQLRAAIKLGGPIVVPSTATAASLVGGGVEPERVTVIEHGADHLGPPDNAALDRLLSHHGLDGPFVLTVGTFEPRKNLERLLAGYARACEMRATRSGRRPGRTCDGIDTMPPLLLAGYEGWLPHALAADLEVTGGRIISLGQVEDAVLAGLYERAMVFLSVPLFEGFGLPVLEAMAAGTPVISSRSVPAAGDAALLVDPYDIEEIAEAIVSLLSDPDQREGFVKAGLERARSHSWKKAASAHLELWQELGAP